MITKKLSLSLFILHLLLFTAYSNIWDNIFSQTQASHPIVLSQSFNINFKLPDQYPFDGNLDFNSQLKLLTITLSKNMIIQNINFIKAQIDLTQLMLNVDQFLIGCQKFTLNFNDQTLSTVKNKINTANFSKKQLFLVNLLFKYIGKYQQKNQGISRQNMQADIFDFFKGNKIFQSITDSGVFKDVKKDNVSSSKKSKFLNMFEFSIDLYKDPKKVIDEIKKGKQTVEDTLDIDEIGDFDLQSFDLNMLKFVLLTDQNTGQIVKAYKNRDLKQQLELDLKSKQKKKIQCRKQAKKLTLQDLTNGAKYIYQNKDSYSGILGG